MKPISKSLIIILGIVLILVLPITLLPNSPFGGADDQAISMIKQLDKGYLPWFEGVKIVESSELTSSLFALQAAIGSAVIAYYIGYTKGKKQHSK